MKKVFVGIIVTFGILVRGAGATYSTNGLNLIIPDGNAAGISSIITVPDFYNAASVSLTLNISGGFDGDIYGYVRHNNQIAVLFNREGRSASLFAGYSDTGFSITFSDSAGADIHNYQSGSFTLNGSGQLTGTWQPDARNIDPAVSLDTSPRSAFLSSFDNGDVSGDWTLFLADVSNGGGPSTLNSWTVTATAVPEPSATFLFVLGGAGLFFVMRRNASRKSKGPQGRE